MALNRFWVANIAHLLFMGIVTNRTMNPGGDFYYICVPQTKKSGNRSKVGYERERKEGEHSDLGVGGPQKVGQRSGGGGGSKPAY